MIAIKESYLHFIWKYLLFDTSGLKTTLGEDIAIIHRGTHNHDQGPDFLQAEIKIGSNTMYGHVEIHIDNKNWYDHKHQFDPNYNTTILHVVLNHTAELYTLSSSQTQIPILCLDTKIENKTLENITQLMSAKSDISCTSIFRLPDPIYISQFKTRIFSERIIRKSAWIKEIIAQNNNDYESSFYQCILSGFGIKVNSDIFLAIAKSLPQLILAKHIDNLETIEALLFGQANLIEPKDEYSKKLYTEYNYLKIKYKLEPIQTKPLKSKMLPGSFPTIRLAQFAAFIYTKTGLYSRLTEFNDLSNLKKYFDINVSTYWQEHYDFDKRHSKSQLLKISEDFFEKLLINIILPFKFLIEIEQDKDASQTIDLYHQLHAEINQKTKIMVENLGLKNKNAFDSQALNEWFTNYCQLKKCLDCTIGYHTLKSK